MWDDFTNIVDFVFGKSTSKKVLLTARKTEKLKPFEIMPGDTKLALSKRIGCENSILDVFRVPVVRPMLRNVTTSAAPIFTSIQMCDSRHGVVLVLLWCFETTAFILDEYI